MLTEKIEQLKPFKDCEEAKEYLNIVSKPFDGVGEVHHVLPESIYPEFQNASWNLVNLKYEDHYRVHELLPFMLEGKARGSMLYAWNLMCGRTSGEFVSAGRYAELRKMHSERVSQQMRENQPMHRPEVVAKFVGRKRPEHSAAMSGDNNPSKREDVRKILSDNNPMKLEENKAKFRGENNPNYGKRMSDKQKDQLRTAMSGKPLSEKTKQKIAKASTGRSLCKVSISGVTYDSVSEVAKVFSIDRHTVSRWIKSGKAVRLTNQAMRVIINGVEFSSIGSAASKLGVSQATIRSMLKHGEATKV